MTKGWDHDPPAQEKLVPFGILMVATGALLFLFGSHETSDAWVDALPMWWRQVRRGHRYVKRLVIDLDNGPKHSGRRTQFWKRIVQFADWSGLEAIPSNRLVKKEASSQDGFATTPFWSGGCDHRHQQGGRRLRELAHSGATAHPETYHPTGRY